MTPSLNDCLLPHKRTSTNRPPDYILSNVDSGIDGSGTVLEQFYSLLGFVGVDDKGLCEALSEEEDRIGVVNCVFVTGELRVPGQKVTK